MDLTNIFLKSHRAKECYNGLAKNPKALPVSVDELKVAIEKFTGLEIRLYKVDYKEELTELVTAQFDLDGSESPEEMAVINAYIEDFVKTKRFLGRLNKYKLSADIFVAKNDVTFCQQRLIATKELAHLIIDDADTESNNIIELISDIVYQADVAEINEQMQSESLAYHVALDLLFPWEYRKDIKAEYDAKNIQSIDIAEKFKIPRKDVERCLSDQMFGAYEYLYNAVHEVLDAIKAMDAK